MRKLPRHLPKISMTIRKFLPGTFALTAAALLCSPLDGRAQDEPTPTPAEDSSSSASYATGKEVLTHDGGKEVMRGSGKETLSDESKDSGSSGNLGTGKFSKSPFHISVSVREGYDDNVYTTKESRVGSWFTNASAVLDYQFGSARTRFDLQAVAGATYYYYRPFGQEYDINTALTLGLEHHATPRLTLSANAYITYQTEPDLNTGIGVNRRAGNYFYTADKFTLAYQWAPRFSTATSYTFGAINYDDSNIGAFEDRFEHTFGNEFRFLVLPTTTLVGEYRFQIIDFDVATRDSTSHFLLAGVDHTFNPRFNVSIRGGAEIREIDNFGERTSPYAESTLRYAAGERTSLAWVSRFGLEEPDVPGSPSRQTFRTGLTLSYAVASRITLTGSVFYEHDDNAGVLAPTFFQPDFTEDTVDLGLGVRYDINRVFAVIAGYNFTEVLSDVALREYYRNRVYLGLNATF